ncbi:M20/M25/M40 family metallo-hydrolase [Maribacter aurantiacus]|uniref:M20/M25/M40 family metallo-hydrolase n=1 Tax=Maribacter aurantiacus TaxID=1882343 RepID=A0A5R8M8A2_9FLAO|nr:M20/M25/M40 family metallo-hydrolase [Maribacter aurantiacus]TLF45725.1 M20/M25/M40 family metallo-hydrolase [Maribacter aurantiacus]
MKKRFFIAILTSFMVYQENWSQKVSAEKIEAMTDEVFIESVSNLRQFLTLPNDGNFPDQIATNLAWCDSAFSALNFRTQVIETEGAPLLFAEKIVRKKGKSVLFYLQIDGQPVDTTKWFQPNPFQPVLKEKKDGKWEIIDFEKLKENVDFNWRIFARSSSDSKGPAMSLISALQILQSKKIQPEYNIKVIMDFQEELGSPHLPKAVAQNRQLLDAEMLFIMDGTRHLSNFPTLTYGARGIATVTLRIFGPKYGLHSGQYGNFAPNPVFEASRLIASMKDEHGKVTIPGFYDGVQLTESDKKSLAAIPENLDSTIVNLGIAAPDEVAPTYQEALQYPSLNIRGMKSAWVEKEVRTIIPSEVIIEIDMRLVPETPGERQVQLLKKHIENFGYHLLDSLPSNAERATYPKLASFKYRLGSQPFRTDLDSSIGLFLNSALNKVFGNNIVNMRTTGGSQPMAPFIKTLEIPAVSIRIPNPDNAIHGPNENLRLGNYREGIMSCLAILTEKLE